LAPQVWGLDFFFFIFLLFSFALLPFFLVQRLAPQVRLFFFSPLFGSLWNAAVGAAGVSLRRQHLLSSG
jgi:hypothetical protein